MDRRMIDFVAALRALGVRVSVAESADAFTAIDALGIKDPHIFETSLKTTLVKEARDIPVFEHLFPLYFGSAGPPLLNALENLSDEEKEMLADALRQLLQQLKDQQPQDPNQQPQGQPGPMSDNQIQNLLNLLQMLLNGQNPGQNQLDQMGQQAGLNQANHPYQQRWIEQRMQRQMGLDKLNDILEQLWELLASAGFDKETIEELKDLLQANQQALQEQIQRYVGSNIAQQAVKEKQKPQSDSLMERPFHSLSEGERELLRQEVRRLAAQLRSKAALRQKRSKTGMPDMRKTMRANMRYGGVPVELRYKTKHLKPQLVMICDVSTSMRPVVEFMLGMIYELQDQVAKARSFAFIDDMAEISDDFVTYPAHEAMDIVLRRMQPGYYNTDLGYSLASFTHNHFDAITHRTTVIFVGDGRNNYNDPRLDCMDQIKRRAKRIIWLNPERPQQWGSGDSDMWAYVPYCDDIHRVSNMTELTAAVDRLLTH